MSQLIGMDDQTVIGAYNTGFETEHKKPGTSLSDAHHGGKMAVALAAQKAMLKEIDILAELADCEDAWQSIRAKLGAGE